MDIPKLEINMYSDCDMVLKDQLLKDAKAIKYRKGSCAGVTCKFCFINKHNIKPEYISHLPNQSLCLFVERCTDYLVQRSLLADQFIALFEEPTVVKLNLTE